jgi:hypothetical protein
LLPPRQLHPLRLLDPWPPRRQSLPSFLLHLLLPSQPLLRLGP